MKPIKVNTVLLRGVNEDEVEPLGELSAPHGVYFVTGNHDYYSGAEAWLARISELGIRPLRNERVQIGSGDGVFDLAGVYPLRMRVVGVLEPSHTPDDGAVFVDLKTTWSIQGLGQVHQPPDGQEPSILKATLTVAL